MSRSNQSTQNIPFTQLKRLIQAEPIPTEPIPFKEGETINDVSVFLSSHFKVVEANSGNKIAMPYYFRLLQYYRYIIEKKG